MFRHTLSSPQTRRVHNILSGIPGWAANLFSLVRPPVTSNSKWALVAKDWLCSPEEPRLLHSQILTLHSSAKLIIFHFS